MVSPLARRSVVQYRKKPGKLKYDKTHPIVSIRAELIPILEEQFRDKPRAWWLYHLQRHEVPCGDAGADVVKVEKPDGGWIRRMQPRINEESTLFSGLNRNKRSIAVDISNEQGVEILYQLLR